MFSFGGRPILRFQSEDERLTLRCNRHALACALLTRTVPLCCATVTSVLSSTLARRQAITLVLQRALHWVDESHLPCSRRCNSAAMKSNTSWRTATLGPVSGCYLRQHARGLTAGPACVTGHHLQARGASLRARSSGLGQITLRSHAGSPPCLQLLTTNLIALVAAGQRVGQVLELLLNMDHNAVFRR